eukprot:CAMPEP_0201511906 /NCGR_PEP_ID=MMETSP0161_2-20130828/4281_1 /ASSEMBLY_ACC=CAM_ASM_000251 /TAXON_ID=180227 /ORGANISM="Neoparamoeba aestuarina, Strain SoJaBio B1-5/56/2" /LENGTH=123 /DNA_ID=CAMNT_0047907567 /DNA_START=120 /DNA_END=491 /DNA_ORIENTATION=+
MGDFDLEYEDGDFSPPSPSKSPPSSSLLSDYKGVSPPVQMVKSMSPEIGEKILKDLIISMLKKIKEAKKTEQGGHDVERRVVREHGFKGKEGGEEEEEGLRVLRSALTLFPTDDEIRQLHEDQ